MKRALRVAVTMTLVVVAAGLMLSRLAGQSRSASCDPDNGGLKLPAGFCAQLVADNLGAARHMAVAPNGDLFVSLRDQTLNNREVPGAIVALRDVDGDGRFEIQEKFGNRGGTGIALRNGYLYHAQQTAVVRYPMKAGELRPSGPPEVIATLPEQRGHTEKGLAFDGRGGLYVNVGAPSNACQEKDRTAGSPGQTPCALLEKHGGIWRFDENKTGQSQDSGGRRYATGMRQFYALTWHDGALYAVQHGRDQLNTLFPQYFNAKQNAELPAEELLRVEDGSNFGWPYCFYDWQQSKRVQMPEYGGDGQKVGDCAKYPPPVAGYPGHWAPGDVLFYTGSQFPRKYQSGAFIAFQGGWNRDPEPAGGYKVVFQPFSGGKASGDSEVFADGFAGVSPLMKREDAKARPAGLAQAPDGSLYISDLVKGRIWRVRAVAAQTAAGEPDPGVKPTRLIDRAEVRVTRVEVQPGATRRVHTHDDVAYHLWVPIEGNLQLTAGSDAPVAAASGQAFFFKRGTPHGFTNVGTKPAAVLEIFVKETTAAPPTGR